MFIFFQSCFRTFVICSKRKIYKFGIFIKSMVESIIERAVTTTNNDAIVSSSRPIATSIVNDKRINDIVVFFNLATKASWSIDSKRPQYELKTIRQRFIPVQLPLYLLLRSHLGVSLKQKQVALWKPRHSLNSV